MFKKYDKPSAYLLIAVGTIQLLFIASEILGIGVEPITKILYEAFHIGALYIPGLSLFGAYLILKKPLNMRLFYYGISSLIIFFPLSSILKILFSEKRDPFIDTLSFAFDKPGSSRGSLLILSSIVLVLILAARIAVKYLMGDKVTDEKEQEDTSFVVPENRELVSNPFDIPEDLDDGEIHVDFKPIPEESCDLEESGNPEESVDDDFHTRLDDIKSEINNYYINEEVEEEEQNIPFQEPVFPEKTEVVDIDEYDRSNRVLSEVVEEELTREEEEFLNSFDEVETFTPAQGEFLQSDPALDFLADDSNETEFANEGYHEEVESEVYTEDYSEYAEYNEPQVSPEDYPEYAEYNDPQVSPVDYPEHAKYNEPQVSPEDYPEHAKYNEPQVSPEDYPEHAEYNEPQDSPEDYPEHAEYNEPQVSPEDYPEYAEYNEPQDSPVEYSEFQEPQYSEPVNLNPVLREIQQSYQDFNQEVDYEVPVEGLLSSNSDNSYMEIDEATKRSAAILEQTLEEFNIKGKVTGIKKGPVITMFELLPAPGVKLSKIVNLSDNIALGLAASNVRIVAPIPGKHAVGIEVPNKKRAVVPFSELIETEDETYEEAAVPIVLGKDISGDNKIIDLAKTPHLLIAGATGAGKSVCVNSLICSILCKRSHNDVKLIMVDPKIVELKLYNGIPHLLTPVITDPKRAFQAIQWCLYEMERRYALLDAIGVRDIKSYNKRIKEQNIATTKLPYMVLIVDEFADLMATSGKELEGILARLAAMSRAVGIHLVLATQRPSIDVITGLIKANFPSRIAFMVSSKTDSRIILDTMGAEKLLGRGDMLFTSSWDPFPVRIQGSFLSDEEVESVVDYVKSLGEPEYIDDEIFLDDEDEESDSNDTVYGDDPLFNRALDIVINAKKASASFLQRRLKIGYNRAARLVEEMEERGIIGPQNGSKPREILRIPDSHKEVEEFV